MSFPTEQDCADAVKAFLSAAGAIPYEVGRVPSPLPLRYTEFSVYRAFGGEPRNGGLPGTQLYRIATRAVADNVDNVRVMRQKAATLEGAVLHPGSSESTPVQFETTDYIAPPSENWQSGYTTWTFAV